MASGYSRYETIPFRYHPDPDDPGLPVFIGHGRIDFDPRRVEIMNLDTLEEMVWAYPMVDQVSGESFSVHITAAGVKSKVLESAGGIKSNPPNEQPAQFGHSPRPTLYGPIRIGAHAMFTEGTLYVAVVSD